ncbi:hypothetical protein [Arthrobacter sp. UYEF20]|uniref:hypothetical protein n=1 Tax=Arthrobacter sp. UYEF20 TaxID=1756363 RepID=UPI0033946040
MNPVGDDGVRPARRKLLARLAVPLLAVALLLAGLILITLPVHAENIGWFA